MDPGRDPGERRAAGVGHRERDRRAEVGQPPDALGVGEAAEHTVQVAVLVDHEVGRAPERELLAGFERALLPAELDDELRSRADDTHGRAHLELGRAAEVEGVARVDLVGHPRFEHGGFRRRPATAARCARASRSRSPSSSTPRRARRRGCATRPSPRRARRGGHARRLGRTPHRACDRRRACRRRTPPNHRGGRAARAPAGGWSPRPTTGRSDRRRAGTARRGAGSGDRPRSGARAPRTTRRGWWLPASPRQAPAG